MSRSLLRTISIPIAAVVFGLVIGAILILTQNASPGTAYKALLVGGAGDSDAVLRTLQKATPLIFGGLAVAFAFKAGMFRATLKATPCSNKSRYFLKKIRL